MKREETKRGCYPPRVEKMLINFLVRPEWNLKPKDKQFEIRAIEVDSGVIRVYRTMYKANIKFIGNTDYLEHGRKPTAYVVVQYDQSSPTGHWLLMTKTTF